MISIVVWDALPLIEADNMYKLLVHKVMFKRIFFLIINGNPSINFLCFLSPYRVVAVDDENY